ncbi:MAG: hypothetical protein EB084_25515, partial [Proteobacteria bacterium]|nr:hypothetical protein [Pseudomonadota bacterium]
MFRLSRGRRLSFALALSALLLTVSAALAAPPEGASGQVAAAPFGTAPPVYATPTPTPVDVFLSGSRFWSGFYANQGSASPDFTVGGYAQYWTLTIKHEQSWDLNAVQNCM